VLHQHFHQLIKHVSCPTDLLVAAPINQKTVFGQHSMRVMDLQLKGLALSLTLVEEVHHGEERFKGKVVGTSHQ
jgi:hypothetical protein